MKYQIHVLLFIGAIGVLNSGCIPPLPLPKDNPFYSEPIYTTLELDHQAKKMIAPPDRALVYYYFIEPDSIYSHYYSGMQIDNYGYTKQVAPGGYYAWLISPGVHTFKLDKSKLTLELFGGKTYFIQQRAELNMLEMSIALVSLDIGYKAIAAKRLMKKDVDNEYYMTITPSTYIDLKMKNMVAPEDKALVYLCRKISEYDPNNANVYIDDNPPVEIAEGTYLLWELIPGTHFFKSNYKSITVFAEARVAYYIRLESNRTLFGSWHYSLQMVDKEEGRKCVEDSTLMLEIPK